MKEHIEQVGMEREQNQTFYFLSRNISNHQVMYRIQTQILSSNDVNAVCRLTPNAHTFLHMDAKGDLKSHALFCRLDSDEDSSTANVTTDS